MAKGSDEPPLPSPPLPTRILCSVTPSASVWFPRCHQSLGEESYYRPFTPSYWKHRCCLCTYGSVWTAGKYGSTRRAIYESVDESQQVNIDEASAGELGANFLQILSSFLSLRVHQLCICTSFTNHLSSI